MGWLQGEVALITGGGSGLGWALVERFLEEGAQVAVLQRSQSKVDALNAHFGDRALAIEATTYASVLSILKSGLDQASPAQEPIRPAPSHDNIRGGVYYQ